MAGRKALRSWLIVAVLLGARSVGAAPITFTGNVANDFNPATNPNVVVIPHSDTPVHIAQPAWMTQAGLVSGWNIQDIRLSYNPATDTMYVGVNTFGIAGDVDGKGLIGKTDTQLTNAGGSNPANFGGDKAMAVGFAPLSGVFNPSNPPAPVIVAGVPGNKSQDGAGLDGFSVAKWAPAGGTAGPNYDLVTSFGTPIPNSGNLAFDPSACASRLRIHHHEFQQALGCQSPERPGHQRRMVRS